MRDDGECTHTKEEHQNAWEMMGNMLRGAASTAHWVLVFKDKRGGSLSGRVHTRGGARSKSQGELCQGNQGGKGRRGYFGGKARVWLDTRVVHLSLWQLAA